jgi:hypothetical protein
MRAGMRSVERRAEVRALIHHDPAARLPWHTFVPALSVIIAVRARFVWTPLTSDEGGFLAIARAWHRGARLYDEVWVDRPQGLVLLFRSWYLLGLGTPEGVRVLGVVACIAGSIACGLIAAELFGRRAAASTATVVGVLSSVPQYEGFIANGELLSSAFGAAGLALALRASWNRVRPAMRGLFVAGMVCGVAMTVKQSGFDAFACAMFAVGWRSCGGRWPTTDRVLAVPVLAAGFFTPLAATLAHGAITGWDRFWFAVIGYRMTTRSALRDADWERFWETAAIVRPAFVPMVVVAAASAVATTRRERAPECCVLICWIAAATVAFVLGGQFHRHYWVILTFPIGTAAAGLVSIVPRRGLRRLGIALMVAAPLWMSVNAIVMPRSEIGPMLSADSRLVRDERIAAWFTRHSIDGDAIYALCASAALYGNASADPPFPYLWHDAVVRIPGANEAMVDMLRSPNRPRYVAIYQRLESCDRTGDLDATLDEFYEPAATIDGIRILEKTSDPTARSRVR